MTDVSNGSNFLLVLAGVFMILTVHCLSIFTLLSIFDIHRVMSTKMAKNHAANYTLPNMRHYTADTS